MCFYSRVGWKASFSLGTHKRWCTLHPTITCAAHRRIQSICCADILTPRVWHWRPSSHSHHWSLFLTCVLWWFVPRICTAVLFVRGADHFVLHICSDFSMWVSRCAAAKHTITPRARDSPQAGKCVWCLPRSEQRVHSTCASLCVWFALVCEYVYVCAQVTWLELGVIKSFIEVVVCVLLFAATPLGFCVCICSSHCLCVCVWGRVEESRRCSCVYSMISVRSGCECCTQPIPLLFGTLAAFSWH